MRHPAKYVIISVIGIIALAILWSVITETLMPLYRNQDYHEFLYNLLGIPIIFIGTGIFAYGGYVFVKDTFSKFSDDQLAENIRIIKSSSASREEVSRAKKENRKTLFSAWRRGSLLLLLGAILIACGGIIINLGKIMNSLE